MEYRKMVLMSLIARAGVEGRSREWTCGRGVGWENFIDIYTQLEFYPVLRRPEEDKVP